MTSVLLKQTDRRKEKNMMVGASEQSKSLCYNWRDREMGGETSELSEG